MEQDKPRIGNRIKQIRKMRELTQTEFAGKLGLSQVRISLIETCKADVSSILIEQIAEVLNVPVSDLFQEAVEK